MVRSPEAKERKRARALAYYYANKEKRAQVTREKCLAWYHANKDAVKNRKRTLEHKEKERAYRASKSELLAPQREVSRIERERAVADRAARREQEKAERKAARIATVAARRSEMKARRYARAKAWRAANRGRYNASQAIYMAEYKKTEKGRAAQRECDKRNRKNPRNKMIHNQRRRLRDFIKRTGSHVHLRFGCSSDFMRAHIEKQFTKGMTWDNYGEWHIDHIMPCAQFDLSNQMHADICFNWQNLRPLWATENLSKSDTITHPQLCLPIAA